MPKRSLGLFAAGLAALAIAWLAASGVIAGNDKSHVKASFTGYEEVPTVSSSGHGTLDLRIDDGAQTIEYTLTYGGLSTAAAASHIHLGARSTAGGVSAFLCGGGSKPACPPGTTSDATVTGTIVASDVVGPTSQGITAGELGELIDAIRAGVTYANVHTSTFPGGEIRGQINDANAR